MVTAVLSDAELRQYAWDTAAAVVDEATLTLPKSDWMQQGGRDGRHSEHLGHLLSELQSLQRSFPGAIW
jgi:ring-1,2-phenylacetyl-CoA epoxidase subunit PaaC